MSCDPVTDPACLAGNLIKSAASSAAGDVLSGIAQAVTDGVKWIVTNTATWWLRIPSPSLSGEPAVTAMQHWLLPVAAAVAVAGVIAAGARMALTRRANPLLDVTGGLLTLAAASTLGLAAASLLLKAGDAWSSWVLQASTGGQFTHRLTLLLTLGGGAAPAVVLVFGVIAIVLSLVQAVLMLFRQAALIILAGVLPLAAAGSIAPLTRAWVRKVSSWMLALICYKPAAAAVYATAFTMIGSGGSPRTMVMGFVMLLLSVFTLPALMKFFTWTTGTIAGSAGGGQLLGAATVGAIAIGAMRGYGGGSAQDQAAYLDSRLGPPSGGSAGPPNGGPPPGPGGPGGSGPASTPSCGAGAEPSGRPAPWPQPGTSNSLGTSAPTGAADPTAPAANPPASTPAPASGAAAASTAAGPITAAAAGAQLAAETTRLANGAMDEGDQR
ncbi:MAG TPA: hypothetical protein VMH35_15830 [Streptosporangiaceae bacterium]|nr:hypothetical protein [Streptosporangiaceae bacterium]